MRKKKKHPEHANHERWLVSYADFITLLFAFFTVMYAISIVDKKRLEAVQAAIRFALNMEGTGGMPSPGTFANGSKAEVIPQDLIVVNSVGRPEYPATERHELMRIKQKIEEKLNAGLGGQIPKTAVEVVITESGIRIRLTEAYFFDPASPVLRPEAIRVVDAIAEVLRPLPHLVRVEGHTDAQNGSDPIFNWKLSADRALALVKYFVQGSSIDPARLILAAFAEHRPIARNDTVEGRALNRRIDIFMFTERNEEALAYKTEGGFRQ